MYKTNKPLLQPLSWIYYLLCNTGFMVERLCDRITVDVIRKKKKSPQAVLMSCKTQVVEFLLFKRKAVLCCYTMGEL